MESLISGWFYDLYIYLQIFSLNMWWLFSKCADCRVLHQVSCLLIRASRGKFDRCPPQWELSSKNGLTLETWIFIFSDNCTMSGHIRPGLMRNRLGLRCVLPRWRRGKWDGERFGVDTGTSKMKEEWERKSLTTSSTTLGTHHAGGKWQNDVMMIHHKVRIANQSYPLPGAQPQLFNIHSY